MLVLSLYGALHLLGGLITLGTIAYHEFPEIKRRANNVAPVPKIILNSLVIVFCWPAVWMDR